MKTAYSTLTTKARTLIPREIRILLGLKAGNLLAYRITTEGILIEKASTKDNDPFATFTEWEGDADERIFDKF